MKRLSVCILIFIIILTTASSGLAQRNDPPEVRELRASIKRLEEIPVNNLAPAMLEIYKKTLLGFYEELLRYVQRQIDSTAAAHARAGLHQQKAQLLDNIAILRMSLGTGADRNSVEATKTKPPVEPPPSVESADTAARSTTESPAEKAEPPATTSTNPPANNSTVSVTSQPASRTVALTEAARTDTPGNTATTASTTTNTGPTTTTTPTTTVTAALPPPCDSSKIAPILKDASQTLARAILFQPPAPAPQLTPAEQVQQIDSDKNKLVFYALADALKPVAIANLEPYRYLGETIRTDKQLGASASSAAAVSRVDKAGFAWLLGLGIENGLVERDVRDTVLTLSTSPAALYMLDQNSSNPYKQAGILNRIGVSASFNISNQDQLLANATRSQLREYSIKYRFAGDRSPRSDKLQKIWNDVAPAIQERLVALNRAAILMDRDPQLNPLVAKTNTDLQAAVLTLLTSAGFTAETDNAKKQNEVSSVILCYLLQNVYPQKGNLPPAVADQFTNVLVPNLVAAQNGLKIVREEFNKRRDAFFEGPLGTIAYINRREPVFGNYSEFKFLFEHPTPILGPVNLEKLTANAGFSFYHQPNAALRQERMRGVNGVISFEGSMRNPFAETLDLDRITYSLTGRYDRLFENSRTPLRKADLASFQFLMNFPIYKGFAFPFSVTYSNATETDRRKGWQTNFGFKLDTDKLKELVRAAGAP